MNGSLDEIALSGAARVNLVLSYSGLATAELLRERFGTPFVVGVPLGEKFSRTLLERLKIAAKTGESSFLCAERTTPKSGGWAVVGEPVYSGSLAAALASDENRPARVFCPLDSPSALLAPGDLLIPDEDAIESAFAGVDGIVADPLYSPVCPTATPFERLPHEAFSGRCFRREAPNLIGVAWKERGKNRC